MRDNVSGRDGEIDWILGIFNLKATGFTNWYMGLGVRERSQTCHQGLESKQKL